MQETKTTRRQEESRIVSVDDKRIHISVAVRMTRDRKTERERERKSRKEKRFCVRDKEIDNNGLCSPCLRATNAPAGGYYIVLPRYLNWRSASQIPKTPTIFFSVLFSIRIREIRPELDILSVKREFLTFTRRPEGLKYCKSS